MHSRRRRVIESGLQVTANMLSQRHNIKVVFKPGECSTTKKQITLPSIPDNATQELVDALQGYLDQQTAYVLYSNLNKVSQVKEGSTKDRKKGQLWEAFQSIEDSRVESEIEKIYPGSRFNIENAHDWMNEGIQENWDDLTDFRKVLAAAFMERRYPDSDFLKNVEPSIMEKVRKVNDRLKREPLTSTEDSLKVAQMLIEEELEQEAQDDQQQSQGGGDQSEDSDGAPAEGSQSSSSDLGDMAEALAQAASQEVQDAGAYAPGRHNYQHDLDDNQGYTIYSTENDDISVFQDEALDNAGPALLDLRDASASIAGIIRRKLVNSLRASTRSRWTGGRPEGKLEARKAYKAIYGISNNVYKVRTKKPQINTAVSLAIDHSGSMAGRPLRLAAESAVVLGDVFNPLKIPFSVYGYSTRNVGWFPQDHELYARWNSLWLKYYKTFEDSWQTGALRLTQAHKHPQQNTLDGEAVLHGVRSLLARPEPRKVLLVFSDGMPYPGAGHVGRCQAHLKSMVKLGQEAGVEIICFGISSQHVKEYYNNWVLVNDLQDLVKEPLKAVDEMLRKGVSKAIRK